MTADSQPTPTAPALTEQLSALTGCTFRSAHGGTEPYVYCTAHGSDWPCRVGQAKAIVRAACVRAVKEALDVVCTHDKALDGAEARGSR